MTKHKSVWAAILLSACFGLAQAAIDTYEFDNPRQEAQYRALIDEFRCPKCQNQNLAGSDAPIAQDLKRKTYEMVKDGRTDAEIRQYMKARYGDFISYKPPVRPSTWLLWFFPPLLLVMALLGWWVKNRRTNVPSLLPAEPLSDAEQARLAALLGDKAAQPPAPLPPQQNKE